MTDDVIEQQIQITEVPHDILVKNIKDLLEKRFGTVINADTGEITHKPFDDINLNGHCGDVSKITNSIVQGEIVGKNIQGTHPSISYKENDKVSEIASGYNLAIHSYVLDGEGNVWDPITKNWGNLKEKDYLEKLIITYEQDSLANPGVK